MSPNGGGGIVTSVIPLSRLVSGQQDPYTSYVLYDSLEDTNGTAITDHTPEKDTAGSGYQDGIGGGEFTITDNKVTLESGDAGYNTDWIPTGLADCTVRCNIKIGDVVANGLIVRASAGNDNLEIILDAANDRVRLYSNTSGSRTELKTVTSVSLDTTSTYAIKVTLDGSAVSLYVDGALKLSHTTTHNQTDHGVGFWQWDGSTTGRWDTLTVAP
jgi:hypothetical protein